jgi:hypothetical protein
VIVSALPAALAGIVWMLFATHTTLSVPALTGAIMCMGVATANSVLVISFARERLAELGDATAAALEAGFVRFRPVLMTALAMVIGMLPMALGPGRGRRAERPAGPRRDRRPGVLDHRHPGLRPRRFQPGPRPPPDSARWTQACHPNPEFLPMQAKSSSNRPLVIGAIALAVAAAVVIGGLATRHRRPSSSRKRRATAPCRR